MEVSSGLCSEGWLSCVMESGLERAEPGQWRVSVSLREIMSNYEERPGPGRLAETGHSSIEALALLFSGSFESASCVSWLHSQAGSKQVAAVLALMPGSTQQTLASVGSHDHS